MIHSPAPVRTRPIRSRTTLAAMAGMTMLCIAARQAAAAPLDLPDGCATAHASLRNGGTNRLDADRLEVSLPAQPGAVLRAAHLDASLQNADLPPGALARAGTAAAAALLVAATGHRDGACSDAAFERAIGPLAQAVAGGGHAAFTWTGISVRAGDKRMGAGRLALHLDGAEGRARVSLSINGAVSNDQAAALLPDSLSVVASLPADQLPALMSAAGGHGAPVDLTIDHLDARRGPTTLEGTGHARIAAERDANSGTAHVAVDGFDALLDAAGAPGLEKLRTALFLARLMAHRHGDQADWDVTWQGGTLLINNVPLPLR